MTIQELQEQLGKEFREKDPFTENVAEEFVKQHWIDHDELMAVVRMQARNVGSLASTGIPISVALQGGILAGFHLGYELALRKMEETQCGDNT